VCKNITEQGARRWSGILFQSLGAAALKAAVPEEEVTVRSVNKFSDCDISGTGG